MELSDNLLTRIAGSWPDFRIRPQQQALVQAMGEHLDLAANAPPHGRILIAEAPTGVGKTLAYLAGALPVARRSGKKLAVATHTVNLQQQVLDQDLPRFIQHAGLGEVRVALAKGRGRFLCPQRLAEALNGGQGALDLGEKVIDFDRARHGKLLERIQHEFTADRWNGDRDAWPERIEPSIWRRLSTDSEGCAQNGCTHYAQCPYYRMRANVDQAEIVVANHDLVLSDLKLGGGLVLPAPEEALYVFDEAHGLPDTAIETFAESCALGQALRLAERAPEWLQKGLMVAHIIPPARANHPFQALQDLHAMLSGIDRLLRDNAGQLLNEGEAKRETRLLERDPARGELWAALVQQGQGLDGLARRLGKLLGALREALVKIDKQRYGGLAATLGRLGGGFQKLADCWALLAEPGDGSNPPVAKWVATARVKADLEFTLHASPVSAAQVLRDKLWSRCAGAVLTSATLRALGSFDLLAERAGLPITDQTRWLALDSPFDYARQAALTVPTMRYRPDAKNDYWREVATQLGEIVSLEEGTLVLFTNREHMRQVHGWLPGPLRGLVLLQDDGLSPLEMVRRHRERIEAGRGSVLFGLKRFAEGVDLPGRLCSHVVITKLPFPTFDDPLGQTLREWMKLNGRNDFDELSLPLMSMSLIQAVGRLLRSETDQGRVSILDRRLTEMRYGRQVLRHLPPIPRSNNAPGKVQIGCAGLWICASVQAGRRAPILAVSGRRNHVV